MSTTPFLQHTEVFCLFRHVESRGKLKKSVLMDEPHHGSLVHPSFFFQALKDIRACAQRGCGRTIIVSGNDVQELCEECRPIACHARYRPPRPPRVTNGALCIFNSKGEYASELHSDPKVNFRKCVEVAAKQKPKRPYAHSFRTDHFGDGVYPPQHVNPGTHKRPAPRHPHLFSHPSQTHRLVPSQSISARRHPSAHSNANAVPSRRTSDPTFPISDNHKDLLARNPTNGQQDPQRSRYPAVPCCSVCQLKLPKHWPGKLCQKCRLKMVCQTDQSVPQGSQPQGLEHHNLASKRQEVINLTSENSPSPLQPPPVEPSNLKIKLNLNRLPASSPLRNSTTNNQLHSSPTQLAQPVDVLDAKQYINQQPISHTLRNLKLCTTINCTGSIPSGSGATRCPDCVKVDWKRRKRHVSPAPSSTSQVFPFPKPVCEGPKRRKSVTWSETITEQSVNGEILHRPALDYAQACGMLVEKEEDVSRSSGYDDQMSIDDDATPGGMSGWDSELSDLTSSDGEDQETPQAAVPTGFKIRLPPRPGGISVRACGNPRCTQKLDVDYRWKTCVLCRSKSREYQRRRTNLENHHNRLNEESTQRHNSTSTMLALNTITPNITRAISVIPRPVGAVPQSRLCSTINCSHVLPSHDVYALDVCSLCRLRRMDCNPLHPDGEGPFKSSPSPIVDLGSKDLLQAFLRLPDQPPQHGRCRSQDCGFVLHPGSLCRQCVARRLVLLKLARLPTDSLAKESTPSSPSENRSYPQFQCFAALLNDFASRLSGFLKAQSVFYLIKVAEQKFVDAKAMFAFDGEYSVVAADFNVLQRKAELDAQAVEYKKEFERLGKMKFVPKRLVSVLESGGISVRFICQHKAPVLEAVKEDDEVTVRVIYKTMHGELEIATLPDRSHCFLPGHKTIIRFRLVG